MMFGDAGESQRRPLPIAWPCTAWIGIRRTVAETIDMLNPSTGLSELTGGPVSLTSFSNGTWVVFYFMGNVELSSHRYRAGSNAVISAMAFDNQCATPAFSPAPGTYTTSTVVTISTATSGCDIRYTTNGTTPSSTVGTVYSSPVSITATSTLQAIAYENGYSNSTVASGVYTIQCATPTFSPAAGSYNSAQTVTISTTTGGATIRYTTNGTTPSSTVGTVYSSAVSITATCTRCRPSPIRPA